jgi:hypothetical protein
MRDGAHGFSARTGESEKAVASSKTDTIKVDTMSTAKLPTEHSLHESVISTEHNSKTPLKIQIQIDPNHCSARLRVVVAGKEYFGGPFGIEDLREASRVLSQGARNLTPEADL